MTDHLPLCVDLDGTLIASDTLYDSLAEVLRTCPWRMAEILMALPRGKLAFKQALAGIVVPDPAGLPYRVEVLDWIRAESRHRPVFLATAADQRIAERVAAHLACFEGVIASRERNLSGAAKARALEARFGSGGFDYAGNASIDLEVWRCARSAIVVTGDNTLTDRARAVAMVARVFPEDRGKPTPRVWARAARVHQWVKNLLLFLAPMAAHRLHEPAVFAEAVLGFIAFCLAASAGYLINDLVDLPADRAHSTKRERPIAAGSITVRAGFLGALLLAAAGLMLALALSPGFAGFVAAYLVLGQAYSAWLKRKVLIDVAVLATLYSLRVAAGAAAVEVPLSFWLLALSAYGFVSLALLKRYAELVAEADRATSVAYRGYRDCDRPVVLAFGAGAGLAASLVMALYVDSQASQNLYAHPEYLWLLVAMLTLGIARLWIAAGRGLLHEDPVLHVFRDRVSLALGAAAALVVVMAV
ncbi:MAG: UbiA family prenyltransferase [Rhodocyclaceae bacterium]|nr:UbiA family prenyltransferase [Rhodocyclaceae bacterium]